MGQRTNQALIAVILAVAVVGATPATAVGATESAPPGELIIRPVAPSELGTSASSGASAMSLSDCSIGRVCAWSGYGYVGQFSWWAESPTGCKNHAANPTLRSGYNGTGFRERVGGWGTIPSHYTWESVGGSVTGELCWGPGI